MNELTCRACGCRIVPEHGYYNTLDGACCITCRERRPLHRLKLQVCDSLCSMCTSLIINSIAL